MGAVAVWLLRHTKMMLAWSIILAAFTLFVRSVSQSSAFTAIGDAVDAAVTMIVDLATLVPGKVTDINNAIHYALDDSNGIGQLLFWLAGLDYLQSILTFISAQISFILSGVVGLGSAALAFAGLAWGLRSTQRWIVALTGGDANGVQVVD